MKEVEERLSGQKQANQEKLAQHNSFFVNERGQCYVREAYCAGFDCSTLQAVEHLYAVRCQIKMIIALQMRQLRTLDISFSLVSHINLRSLALLEELSLQSTSLKRINVNNNPCLKQVNFSFSGITYLTSTRFGVMLAQNSLLRKCNLQQRENLIQLIQDNGQVFCDQQQHNVLTTHFTLWGPIPRRSYYQYSKQLQLKKKRHIFDTQRYFNAETVDLCDVAANELIDERNLELCQQLILHNECISVSTLYLQNLKELSINDTEISTLDTTYLKYLLVLSAENTDICVLDFSQLIFLRRIKMRYSKLEHAILDQLLGPEYIDLQASQVKVLTLSNAQNLQYLNCSFTKITDLAIPRCQDLISLRIAGLKLANVNVKLGDQIQYLDLYRSNIQRINNNELLIDQPGISLIDALPRLISFDISFTNIQIQSLSKQSQLEYLGIRDAPINQISIGRNSNIYKIYKSREQRVVPFSRDIDTSYSRADDDLSSESQWNYI